MESTYQLLLSLGGIFLVGQLTSTIGRRSFLPRVTLLLLFGILIGKEALDIIPEVFDQWFELIAEMTLMMVGFLIGGKLTFNELKNGMQKVIWISVCAAVFTTLFVFVALWWAGLSVELAILLGCIASATAPAATLDVVMESDADTPFSRLLVSIVALDDAWALLLFGVGTSMALVLTGNGSGEQTLWIAFKELVGAVLLGVLIGGPAAFLTGRLKPGEPILTEALGLVFLCGGLALWFEVSFLISAIVMGAMVANFASHHDYPFHAIENIEWPFMVIFFVLAGATLELKTLIDIGLIGGLYIAFRTVGKVLGARIGAQIGKADQGVQNWMGVALLPQAGVAIGMALVAANSFPEHRQILLSLVIGSTVVFEIVGPLFTRLAIQRTSKR